jgi:hypothetical protein
MTREQLSNEFEDIRQIESGLKLLERVPGVKRIIEVFALFLNFIAAVLPLFYEPSSKKWKWPLNPLVYVTVIREVRDLLRGVLGRHTN